MSDLIGHDGSDVKLPASVAIHTVTDAEIDAAIEAQDTPVARLTRAQKIGLILRDREIGLSLGSTEPAGSTRIAVVGGDDRVLSLRWPPWYAVAHFGRNDHARLTTVLHTGRPELVVVLMRWCPGQLRRAATDTAHALKIPIHMWERGLGELLKTLPGLLPPRAEASSAATIPDEERTYVRPRKPPLIEPGEMVQAPVAYAVPEPEPEPVLREQPREDEGDEEEDDDAAPSEPADDAYLFDAAAALVAPGGARVNSWTKEEIDTLVVAWLHCNGDADRLMTDFHNLGGHRTASALMFQLSRLLLAAGETLPAPMEVRLRVLAKSDRRKKTLLLAEVREPSPAQAAAAAVAAAAEHTPASAPTAAVALDAPARGDAFQRRVLWEMTGVSLGLRTRDEALASIAALVGVPL